MKPSTARVLHLLRQGPQTTHTLCQPEAGGVRFGARLGELRELGFVVSERRLRPGSSEYRLVRDVQQAASEANGALRREQADPAPVPSTEGVRSASPAEHLGLFDSGEFHRPAGAYEDAA